MAIFLNFDWLLVVSFVFSANQKLFVFCTCVTSLHLCYRRTVFLSQPIRIGYFFRVYYQFWNTQGLNQLPCDPSDQTLSLWIS